MAKTLREYMEELKELAEAHPEALDYPVVYSRDDEGNGFQHVHYSPDVGHFEDGEFDKDEDPKNAVVIN